MEACCARHAGLFDIVNFLARILRKADAGFRMECALNKRIPEKWTPVFG